MRQITPHSLWLGHAGDLRTPAALYANEIRAVVDLAGNEPVPVLPRDLIYCHIPLVDGTGNDPGILRLAADTVAQLLLGEFATAVCCSNGMSRAPAIAAAGLATLQQRPFDELLREVASQGGHDVLPGLWEEVKTACR